MVKFGKYFKLHCVAEWQEFCINYRQLKKLAKRIRKEPPQIISTHLAGAFDNPGEYQPLADSDNLDKNSRVFLEDEFHQLLNSNILKLTTFCQQKMDEYRDHLIKIETKIRAGPTEEPSTSKSTKGALLFKSDAGNNGNAAVDSSKAWKDSIIDSLVKYYKGLELLSNHALLNEQAYYKIMKKFHKMAYGIKFPAEVYNQAVKKLPWRPTVVPLPDLIHQTEELYISLHDLAMAHSTARLELTLPTKSNVHKNIRDNAEYGVFGFITGVTGCMTTLCILICVHNVPWKAADDFVAAFPVYRLWTQVILLLWLWGLVVRAWTKTRVNFVFIFQFHAATRLDYYDIFRFAGFLTMIFVSALLLELVSAKYDVWIFHRNSQHSTFVMTLGILLIFLCPLDIFHKRSRVYVAKTLGRIVISPFSDVRVPEFFLADILTSMVKPMQDAVYTACYFTTESWIIREAATCTETTTFSKPILCGIPFWFRFMQCLHRYNKSHDANPHLLNALKYACGFFTVLIGTIHKFYGDASLDALSPLFWVWVAATVCTTLYTFWWDLIMDWSFFQAGAKKRFLRQRLVLDRTWIYYYVIASNLAMRFLWAITISPVTISIGPPMYQPLFLGCIEIYRRMQWAYFRIENEHVSNVGKLRAIDEIPLLQDKEVRPQDYSRRKKQTRLTSVGFFTVFLVGLIVVVTT
eukprot:GFYU01009129.1.p1 GENE.GFYU01009129.1~~GFYU01009129.1.p1  ORF type:complete len:690 (+),score=171.70 GFYU01009129.1:155-2224(+)